MTDADRAPPSSRAEGEAPHGPSAISEAGPSALPEKVSVAPDRFAALPMTAPAQASPGRHRPGARAGFTLLEMLVAITLVSLIMGAILGGLHLGKRAWETGKSYETVSEIEEAARAVGAQLARAASLTLVRSDNAQIVAFQGRSDGCRFVALSEGEAQWGGFILTEIGGADDPPNELAVWTRVFRPAESFGLARDAMRKSWVLRDTAQFRLSYFGEVEKGRPPVWTDQWIDRQVLPLLVGVRLAGQSAGRVVDVSFTVALRQR